MIFWFLVISLAILSICPRSPAPGKGPSGQAGNFPPRKPLECLKTGKDLLAVVKCDERVCKPARVRFLASSSAHKGSAVLAPSTAQGRGASLRFAPFGVTCAARGALPGGRSGRRDGRRGRTKGWSGRDGRRNLVVGVEQGLALQHGAGDRQQSIGEGSQRAS